MKPFLARLLFLCAAVSAAAQPTIPVSNLSPLTGPSVIGREAGTGRAQVIPLGAGLSFSGGALTAAGGGGGGAPVNATYITQTPNATLTNEQALSALSSGLMFVTTTTGVITSLGTALPAANGGFGVSVSGSSGVPLFSGGVPTFTGTSGTGVFARVGAPTFTGNVAMSGNLAVTGNITVGNMTTTNLTITGSITGVMGAANGGTGQSSYAIGDIIYASGATTLSKLADVATGNVIISGGVTTAPAYGKVGLTTHVSGTLPATSGGTGQSTFTKGDLLAAADASTVNKLSVGSNGLVLTANSSATNGVSWETASGGTVTASGPPSAGQAALWTSATNLQGVTVTGTGAPVLGTSPAFTTNLTLANGASPSTGAVAATAFDTDAWAASRGAVQVHDGTANTFLVGVLASDTPSNAQVPTWNTGGTVTWETPSAGGSGTVSSASANQVAVYTAATTVGGDAGLTYDPTTDTLTITGTTTALLNISAAAASTPYIAYNIAGTPKFYTGVSGAADGLIPGSVAGDGVIRVQAGNKLLLGTNGFDSATLRLTTANTVATLEPLPTSAGLHIKPAGAGFFHVGVSAYAVGAFSIPNSFAYPAAKTSTTPVNAFFIGSNDGSNPFGLNFNIAGNGTAASRIIKLQAGAVGVDSAGIIQIDGTKVELYGTSSTLSATATSTQLIAETTTASTSTTSGALMSKGGLGVAGRTSTATLNVGTGTTLNSIFSASASLDFGSILTTAEATLTITVTGVATTNTPSVALGWSAALEDGIIVKQAWVSAADTVSVRVANVSIGSINPAAVTCRATVTSF